MPDDVSTISVSAAKVLTQTTGRLQQANSHLAEILQRIESALWPDEPQLNLTTQPLWRSLAEIQSDLLKLRGDLQSAVDTVRVLQSLPQTVSREPDASSAGEQAETEAKPLGSDRAVASTELSATSAHRMSEIRDTLSLTEQQALERCIATQFFVDSRLREGWRFFIKRGRERRAVAFHGAPSDITRGGS
jgi:hypothetical protein